MKLYLLKNKMPTTIELFAGAGGMALGFEKAGFDNKMLIDNNKDCIKTLRKNRPKWNVVEKDIQEFDFTGM